MKRKLIRMMCALFAAMVSMSVNAQTGGDCGFPNAADVQWSYDNGTLTFMGTGAMNMYSEDMPQAPWWNDYFETTTTVVVGEGITTIPHWGFAMFENLTSVTLPSTLTTIGKAALEECAFTTIDLPEGLTTIGDYAFQIGALTSVTIPSTVTYIGEVAFQAMESLTTVTFLNTDPTTITFGENVFQACDNLTAINVPAGKVDAYKAALPDYAALIVEGGAPTPATSGSCGTNATWSYSNGILSISGSGAMDDFSSSMTDIPWIAYQESISRVVIGDEITHVGDWAFQGCTALNSVTIGENVTSIGNGSFDNCTNDGFTVLTIPNSVQTIGIDAFSNNHLKYVCFGSGLTSIGMEAFMVCQDLEAIGVYASTPPTLGMEAFMACSNLATIYVPSSKIGDYKVANGWSDYAAMIKSPSGDCGDNATWSFEMATGTLTIEGTGAIDEFSGWDSTQDNDSRAFNPFNAEWYPYGIKSLVIGEGITEIPASAFYMEAGITDVALPSTLTAIGMDAFGECENIETITCDATTPPTLADEGNESYVFYVPNADWSDILPIPTVTAIYVPAAAVDAYKAAAGWSDYADKIVAQGGAPATTTTFTYTATEQVTKFDTYANFTGATGLKSHTFADGAGTVVYEGTVTGLGLRALNATKLTAITIPETVTAIGDRAFIDCTTLATITFDGTPAVTTIGEYALAGCSAMTSFTIPAGVTTIGQGAFQGSKELVSITIPESVTNVSDYMFNNCKKLATVTFTGTPVLSSIGKRAFYDCEALTAIAIPASVETIKSDAFEGCSLLASVTFPGTSALTSIGTGAFGSCKALTTITLPESVTTLGEIQVVGEETYYNNSIFWGAGLTSFVLPKNVTHIYGGAMVSNCPITSLTVDPENTTYDDRGSNAIFETATDKLVIGCVATTVPDGTKAIGREAFFAEEQPFALTLPASVTSIEARAFHFAHGLTSINIPDAVTTLYAETFPCMGLETLILGSGLTLIEAGTFEGCNNLSDIYCYADPAALTWNMGKWDFKSAKGTQCHVANAAAWESAMPDAYVTFVGDLVDFTLSEETDNAAALSGRNGHTANVTLTRTLQAGSYNTFAVPFDIDAATLAAKGITAKKLASSTLTGGTLTLNFEDADEIEAGKPYLVKVDDNLNLGVIAFDGVTVSKTATTTMTDFADFVPTMGKTTIEGVDAENVLFLAAENKLKNPSGIPAYMKGFRAYFVLTGANAAREFVLDLGDETTGIADVRGQKEDARGDYYDLQGRRVNGAAQKGVYIVNGKKTVIK